KNSGKTGKLVTERYLQEFARCGHGDVAEAFAELEQRIHDEAGSLDQKDDLTLMCLSVGTPETQTQSAATSVAAIASR
ncbi:MAG: hypothetical protein ACOC3G_03850, partial [Phycisphaeraceae bacterium]